MFGEFIARSQQFKQNICCYLADRLNLLNGYLIFNGPDTRQAHETKCLSTVTMGIHTQHTLFGEWINGIIRIWRIQLGIFHYCAYTPIMRSWWQWRWHGFQWISTAFISRWCVATIWMMSFGLFCYFVVVVIYFSLHYHWVYVCLTTTACWFGWCTNSLSKYLYAGFQNIWRSLYFYRFATCSALSYNVLKLFQRFLNINIIKTLSKYEYYWTIQV